MKTPLRHFQLLLFLYCFGLLASPYPIHAELPDALSVLSEMGKKTTFVKLSNGVRVLLYRRELAPVFSVVLGVRVGGTDEVLGETGISHMLEHMAFKGTPDTGTLDYNREKDLLQELEEIVLRQGSDGKLSAADQSRWDAIHTELSQLWITGGFTRELENQGADDLNANTGKELTKYFMNLPRKAFEFWCKNESERIFNPVMRQFYQERDVVMEERRMRYDDDPQGKLYEMTLATVFLQHPYRNPVIGYPFDLEQLTATRVAEFHKRYYVANNIVISIVGDVHPEKDIPMLEKYFGRIPNNPVPPRTKAVEAPQLGERRVSLNARSQPQLFIVYHKPQYPDADDPPLSLLMTVLAELKISPLYTELVKKRQLATSVGVSEEPGSASPNSIFFHMAPRTPHTNDELLQAFDDVLRHFKRKKVSPELLEIAKRTTAVDYLAGLKTDLSLAEHLTASELIYNDWKIALKWLEEAMAVTPEDIRRVADQYLRPENRTIARLESLK